MMKVGHKMMWTLAGAIIGNLTAEPISALRITGMQALCRTQQHLSEGNQLHQRAVELQRRLQRGGDASPSLCQRIEELHRDANAAFKLAGKCGSARAIANLGTAHCYGWAVPVNQAKGWNLIREAATMDPSVGVEWFSNPSYCHAIPRTGFADGMSRPGNCSSFRSSAK